MDRERLASRLGFLLLSAGCAIGLGNVWRFPWITGQYGGAWFVLIYLFFLLALGLPVMVIEFSMGRASRRNMGRAFHVLTPEKKGWHKFGLLGLVGSYLLMIMYIPIAGWMLAYCWYMGTGQLDLSPADVQAFFGQMLSQPVTMTFWSILTLVLSLAVCWFGVRGGLERVSKVIMSGLLLIMIALAIRAVTLDGATEGLEFYLAPDFERLKNAGILNAVSAAMNQAFFTLSLGNGAMMIFGSYFNNERNLTGESLCIVGLDTFVALTSGLIIFPACFAYGVQPDSGPGLVLITLPNIFNQMPMGNFWGCLFFVFMSCAALTTVIAVMENIVSYSMDVNGWQRKSSIVVHLVLMSILIMPCILGFNVLKDITPFGPGSCILDLEDFIISNNVLPLGSLCMLIYCTSKYGWGWKNFVTETDKGKGPKFPHWARFYLTWILPIVILVLFVNGYIDKFFK